MENIALIDSYSEFKDNKSIDRVTLMVILPNVFTASFLAFDLTPSSGGGVEKKNKRRFRDLEK